MLQVGVHTYASRKISRLFVTFTSVLLSVFALVPSLICAHSPLNVQILSSTSVAFTVLTTAQGPNLALVETKRITVCFSNDIKKTFVLLLVNSLRTVYPPNEEKKGS
jgi:hypothetical protein